MPVYEDDGPKLAEIARTLSDFRHEFRDAVSKMVRADVYVADMRTMEVRMSTVAQEIMRLDKQQQDDRADRRSLRNITLTALVGVLVSMIGTAFALLVK